MFGLASVELSIRVHGPGPRAPHRLPRLRRRRDPLARRGRVWQLVAYVDVAHPALVDVLATCHGFRVDDHRGNTIGLVEQVVLAPDPDGPADLIVRAWDRQWVTVPFDDVVEIVPGSRRLVTDRTGCAS